MPPVESLPDATSMGLAAAVSALTTAIGQGLAWLKGRDQREAEASKLRALGEQISALTKTTGDLQIDHIRSAAEWKSLNEAVIRLSADYAKMEARTQRSDEAVRRDLEPVRKALTDLHLMMARMGADR